MVAVVGLGMLIIVGARGWRDVCSFEYGRIGNLIKGCRVKNDQGIKDE